LSGYCCITFDNWDKKRYLQAATYVLNSAKALARVEYSGVLVNELQKKLVGVAAVSRVRPLIFRCCILNQPKIYFKLANLRLWRTQAAKPERQRTQ
jgi:hypothetical protein